MPMTPKQKAKQTARQEAEWGHTRPEPPPVDNEHVAEGCEQFAEPVAADVVPPEPPPVTNTVSKAATTARRKSAAKKK